jgi:hypothetical protein
MRASAVWNCQSTTFCSTSRSANNCNVHLAAPDDEIQPMLAMIAEIERVADYSLTYACNDRRNAGIDNQLQGR